MVDKSFTSLDVQRYTNKKIELIKSGALSAIKLLKKRNLKVDCLVTTNEGLFEGGGIYPIFGEFLLGYLSPILADELLVVMDISYYSAVHIKSKVVKMDWGFKVQRMLNFNDPDFIYPSLFTEPYKSTGNPRVPDFGDVIHLSREYREKRGEIGNTMVKIAHRSIFSDYNELDAIGIAYPKDENKEERKHFYPYVSKFFYNHKKIFSIRHQSIEKIIKFCAIHKVESLGLVPWMNGNYNSLISFLEEGGFEYPKTIHFYHLNKSDFTAIYAYLEVNK